MRTPTPTVRRAAISLCVLAWLALPGSVGADRIGRLRAERDALAAREQAALLQLYALNTSLDRARGRLAEIETGLAAVRMDQDIGRRQLRAAQRTLILARARLGRQIRAQYEQDNPDTLAVLFGAASLDDIITGLDSVNTSAASTADLIAQTRLARDRVRVGLASVDRRAARLATLRAAAAAQAAALDQARSERSAYIGRLRTGERLTTQRIAALEAQARAAEAASTVATVKAEALKSLSALGPASAAQAPATPSAPAVPAAPAPIQPASGSGKQLTVVATAYSLHGGTASGLSTSPGVVAVDPTVIPLGTRLYIPGYGPGIAADTGTAIKGLRIDLWFPTLSQADNWGRRTVTITVY